MVDQPIVEVRDLRKTFAVKYAGGVSTLHASNGVTFDIMRGETLGLVGESGSGKTAPPVFAGEVPSLLDPPPGYCFHPRCAFAMERWRVEVPGEPSAGRRVACNLFST
ncbi:MULTISPECIES: hypothetical protein [unclassified Bradyrhizobium]